MARRVWREPSENLWSVARRKPAGDAEQESALLATFQAIALERFAGAPIASARKQSPVIVSDMIDMCRANIHNIRRLISAMPKFRNSPYYRSLRTDLNGAEVLIFYIDRNGPGCRPIDTGAHMMFWREWVGDNNGRLDDRTAKLQEPASNGDPAASRPPTAPYLGRCCFSPSCSREPPISCGRSWSISRPSRSPAYRSA